MLLSPLELGSRAAPVAGYFVCRDPHPVPVASGRLFEELLGPAAVQPDGAVVRRRCGELVEERHGFLPLARAVECDPAVVSREELPPLGRSVAGAAQEFVDPHGLGPSLDGDQVQEAVLEGVAGGLARGLADHDVDAVFLAEPLEAGRDVHRVADGRVGETVPGPQVAHDHRPGVDADPHVEAFPPVRRELEPERAERRDHLQRALARAAGMVGLRDGRVPERLQPVPGVVGQDAVVPEHDRGHLAHVVVQQRHEGFGRQARGRAS